jgi:two-component system cell cycle response regulator
VRYGGEEFVVVMPDTGSDDANLVAARLTHNITEAPIPVSHEVGEVEITVSAGVAVVNGVDDTAETLLQRADDALYAAKRGGRNRVVMAG